MSQERKLTPTGAAKVFELKIRPDFVERIATLAGRTTWREPNEGYCTKVTPVPEAHQIAAALGFARLNGDDFGPDVALAIATGQDYRKERTLLAVVRACAKRCTDRELLDWADAALWAWDSLVHGKGTAAPENKRRVCEALLWSEANDAVWRARRALWEHAESA